jgi:hypothetical protein
LLVPLGNGVTLTVVTYAHVTFAIRFSVHFSFGGEDIDEGVGMRGGRSIADEESTRANVGLRDLVDVVGDRADGSVGSDKGPDVVVVAVDIFAGNSGLFVKFVPMMMKKKTKSQESLLFVVLD